MKKALFSLVLLFAVFTRIWAITITTSANVTTICSGGSVTFTGTIANAFILTSYQWYDNGVAMTGTGNNGGFVIPGNGTFTFTTSSLSNGDNITCNVNGLLSGVTSTAIPITVNANVTPTVTISSNSGLAVCSGAATVFTAAPVNCGTSPTYAWKKNGTAVGTNNITYSDNSLSNNDFITCTVTGNAPCSSVNPVISNSLTMSVSSNLIPSVAISSSVGVSICSGVSATFTAVPTNGGASPTYQWKKNGSNVGSGGTSYTDNSLVSADVITCVMTGSASCATATTATSNTLTLSVGANVIPSAAITANVGLSICSGSAVIFTAVATNGGAAPSYQWKKNGNNVGTGLTTYTDVSLNNNDIITCALTSNATCATTISPVLSNALTAIVNPVVTPSVSVAASIGLSICSGVSVTFNATATAGGATPSYQWRKNGINVGANASAYVDNGLLNADIITCIMTTSALCATSNTATSNSLALNVAGNATPSVSISSSVGLSLCSGTSTVFTAVAVNGGLLPSYQWKKNGVNVGTNSAVYTDIALNNNDVITCVLTSNALCVSTNTATSNALTMTVNANLTPSVTISSSVGLTICSGTAAIFTAVPLNAGLLPSCQWKKNGTNVGINSLVYTDLSLNNNDIITCVITSNALCGANSTVTSNALAITVNLNLIPSVTASNSAGTTFCAGTPCTFTATPTNCGTSPFYQWRKNGSNIGANSPTYTDNNCNNGDVVSCMVTGNAVCATLSSVTTNLLILTVNALSVPSVTISSNVGLSLCSGISATFTASAVNCGSNPSYQWKKNGINVGTNLSTYTDNSLLDVDIITCVVTSSATCPATPTVTSNALTMSISANLVPSVTISSNVGVTICSGTAAIFTAVPLNAGLLPSCQWKKNGTNVGINSLVYTDLSLNNNDIITCVITSNALCGANSTATSNALAITVNLNLIPSVAASNSAGTTFCAGTPCTFTATPTNCGTSPFYQWRKNGSNIGANSPTYTDNNCNNGDVVSCMVTGNAVCATLSSVTTNLLILTVNALSVPSVTISSNVGLSLCSGISATFTASAVNCGSNPSYQWKKNGINVGTNLSTYTDNSLLDVDIITCVVTSSATCPATPTVTSNALTMSISANLVPSVTISSNVGVTICSGTAAIFTAVPLNAGLLPSCQWKKNGTNVGTNSLVYTDLSLNNNDIITCVITSNALCGATSTATSNVLTLAVNLNLVPSAVVTNSAGTTFCSGTPCTFTAVPTNCGTTPSYQWKKNGNNVGANSTTYSDNNCGNGDVISCVVNGNALCATLSNVTSNLLTLVVNALSVPVVTISSNVGISICSGVSATFTASAVNCGSSPSYQWKKNGINVGTNLSTYTDNGLLNVDIITCVVTSSATCPATPTVTSNALTMSISANLVPSVTISSNVGVTICSGTAAIFTAVPLNAGLLPSCQWKKNGTNVGTNSLVYTDLALNNNDIITCVITSNALCGANSTATSNVLTLAVNLNLVPSAVVTNSAGTTFCSGTPCTFTAVPTNCGASPSYQWRKNGSNIGTNSPTYIDNNCNNGDVVSCLVTGNAVCATLSSVTTNLLILAVNALSVPSVTISSNVGISICSGVSATFTASAVNCGSSPSYQWKKNGINVGTNLSTYVDNGLISADIITCVVTSNATCPATPTATSNALAITVTPTLTPSVTINSNVGVTICSGTVAIFTAVPLNAGLLPSCQWKKNGTNVGTNSLVYTDLALNNNDIITCVITSNALCSANSTVTSNALTISVNLNLIPSAVVTNSAGTTFCSGTPCTFTAVPTNCGTSPSYQWRKNGNNVGTNSATYSDNSCGNGDVVSCLITGNALCATLSSVTSNLLILTVNPAVTPTVAISSNIGVSICAGAIAVFTATPANCGTAPAYQWLKNGANVGTNSATYTDNSLNNGDVITCVVTGSATCATTSTALSNTLAINVNTNVNPSVAITSSVGVNICSGTTAVFTAVPVNCGVTPVYQWKKNGSNTGSNSATYTDNSLNNSDVITCVVTSSATCAATNIATSNVLAITVNTTVIPSASIASNIGTTICTGATAVFTATPVNCGIAPAYQWTKNGSNVGTNSAVYTDNGLNNNDVIACTVTGNAPCATLASISTNTLTITVNNTAVPQPGAFTASSAIAYQGQVGVVYTVPPIANTTYNWSYTGTGATITGTGNTVTVTYSTTATSGTLGVTATNSGCSAPSAARTIAITVKPYITWNCSVNNDWTNGANWDAGFAPYGTISVLIPAGTPCQPSVPATNAVNNMTINSGATVNINSGELDANGNVTINGTVTGGYLNLTGTAAQAITGNGTVNNLALNNSNGATINNGDVIHIVTTYKPGTGTLNTNNGLELLSDVNGTATILGGASSCSYIVGEVTCDKYIHGGRRAFRFFGHPFSTSIPLSQLEAYFDITGSGGSANGFTTTNSNNPSAFWYNTTLGNGSTVEDSTGWTDFTGTNGAGVNAWNRYEGMRALVRGSKGQGLGCDVCIPNAVTMKMHGTINECDQTVTLLPNANVGFNFISNPYPADIDMSLATRGNAIGANFSVWDPNQGLVGAYVDQPFNIPYVLSAYSSFFTTCNNNAGKTITFHESDKTAAAPDGNLFKTTGLGNNAVQLRILSNNDSLSWDRLLLFFNDQAMAGLDVADNNKMYNPDLTFYSFSADNNQLGIDQRPYVSGQVVKLGIVTDTNQTYSIRVDDFTPPAGAIIYLHDKFLNQTQQLSSGMHYSFTVTSNAASQGDNRFELNLSGTTGITNVSAAAPMKVDMFPNPATDNAIVSFEAPQKGTTILTITNLVGQQVYVNQLGQQQTGKIDLSLNTLTSGVYMVTLKCGDLSVTKRFVKQ